ncbi:Amidase domain-containing protein [Mycena indigotica]|uniref:Amidase domain-containing protein n=1 Tax=Mycena indigotica TaxID=2126181 RepID=A0A8H6WKU0_9AGAR|nr:Amidase domain-containing protein [Mycena indigotica]KAF7316089.1 Amidase domain-containing protein [Mycena indigotica]
MLTSIFLATSVAILSFLTPLQVYAATLPDLYEATIADLQAGLDAKAFTSVDLVTAYIARIKEVNSELHAVIEISPTALALAAALDSQRSQGKKIGPFHGIPILVKDNIATRFEDGMNTTAGSYALLNSVVPGDSTVVAKLRAAGAIILGKTNMSEWAAFGPMAPAGWSGRGGLTTNAYYPKGNACGSSSGSGVAASIGLAAATLGTETAGSITCPASANNVVGVKATVGLTSRSGVVPISQHQDTVGPLARTVTDAALILNAIAGKDSADNYTSAQPSAVPDYTKALTKDALKGARIGVPRAVFLDPKTAPLVGPDEFKAALETMKGLGAVITDPANVASAEDSLFRSGADIVLHTDLRFDIQAYLATLKEIPTNVHNIQDIMAFNDAHKDLEEPRLDAYVEWNLHFEIGKNLERDSNYTAALATDLSIGVTKGIDATLKEHSLDALVLPLSSTMYVLAGMAGSPIVTVPLGFQANTTKPADAGGKDEPLETAPNMPFGLMFVGAAWSESKLLAYAYAYEQATNTRLKQRAYDKATPKTQLVDVVGKSVAGSQSGSAGNPGPTHSWGQRRARLDWVLFAGFTSTLIFSLT